MKKICFVAAALCAMVLASCQAQLNPQEETIQEETPQEVNGVPMTLKVSFGDTKTTYSPNGIAGFSCNWEAGDKISVISFDSDSDYASITAIDNFETTAGDGTFEGTFTGGSAPRIMVVYPHLEAYEGSASGNWGTEALNGAFSRRLIDGVKIGENRMSLYPYTFVYADENVDMDVLKERCLFYGQATIDAGAMTATLQNLYSVLTVTLDFRGATNPDDLWDESPVTSAIKTVEINADHFAFENFSWGYPASFKAGSTSNLSRQISYFGAPNLEESDATGLVPPTRGSGERSWLKYYIVGNFVDQKTGYKWNVTATSADGNTFVKELTFSGDYAFNKGSGAAFSATLTGTIPALPAASVLDADGAEPANCYIVPCTASTYSFSVKSKQGFSYPNTYNASYSAVVLWESLPYNNSVEVGSVIKNAMLCSDNRIYVETTGTEGNAVVAIVNGEGTIIWSWHLWVTDYDPNGSASDYNYINLDGTEYYMMKRNLGAFYNSAESINGYREEQVGLYYQFGRKDPFVGVNNIYEASVNRETTNSGNWAQVNCGGLVNKAYASSNPMTFIKGTTASKSWLPSVGAVDGLWGTATKEQDPCPYGWRVADTEIWTAIKEKADRTIDGSDVNFWGSAPDKRPISKTIHDSGTYGGTYQFDGLTLPYCGFYYYNTGDSSWSIWQTYSYSVDVGDAEYWGNSMINSEEAYTFSVSSIDMYQFETYAETEWPASALQVRCVRQP